jgi:hypothetical protein
LRRARHLRAIIGVGLQHIIAARMSRDVVIDVVVGSAFSVPPSSSMAIGLKRFIFDLHRRDSRLGYRSRRTSAPVQMQTITNWKRECVHLAQRANRIL